MGNLLNLDFVSHVSLVDEPAVEDAKYLVAKRADGDGPGAVGKAGRQLSQSNFEKLEDILQSVRRGRVAEVEEELETVLSDVADPDQIEQSNTLEKILKSMSDGDSNGDGVEQFTEVMQDLQKSVEELNDNLEDADLQDDGDAGGDGDAGSQDGGDVNSDIMDRIDELEEQLSGDGDAGSSSDGGSQETQTQDGDAGGDGDGDVPDDSLEKRLENIEKSLEQQDGDRRGRGSILDNQDEDDSPVAKGDGSWSFQDSIQKSREQAANQQTQESD